MTRISFLVAQMVKNLLAMQETQVWFLAWEGTLEKETAMSSSILAGESHGWRSLAGYSPWGSKELDMTERASTRVPPVNTFCARWFSYRTCSVSFQIWILLITGIRIFISNTRMLRPTYIKDLLKLLSPESPNRFHCSDSTTACA